MNRQSARKTRPFRRPAAWDRARGPLELSVKAAEGKIAIPPGLWHVSDHASRELATNPGVVMMAARHKTTDEPYRLLVSPSGRVLGVSAESDAGLKRINMADPSAWASRQAWDFQPIVALV